MDSAFQGCCRDDVPDFGFDYVGGYEVYLVVGVGDAVVGYVAFVGASAFVFGALDLDAEEAAVVFDGEVVGGHVSPGLGDGESVLGGAGHETQFGPLAPELGVLDVDSLIGHSYLEMDSESVNLADRSVRPTLLPMKNAAFLGPRWLAIYCKSIISHGNGSSCHFWKFIFVSVAWSWGELGGFCLLTRVFPNWELGGFGVKKSSFARLDSRSPLSVNAHVHAGEGARDTRSFSSVEF